MHIHILGICGTFMGSLAQLAKAQGHRVTGSDLNVYPPMSTQLEQAGIELIQGFDPDQLNLKPDVVVVGNVVSRGNPVMEAVLDRGLPYISGPQWLSENVLQGKWVLGVSGTHGKTTTATMLTWILESTGMSPGYLIGGVPCDLPTSARLGESDFFVIEADEYDTAFFDKRSKFVHYHPRTLIINNLEFDHADIFPDLAAIQRQFHHVIRTVPNNGLVLHPKIEAIQETLALGCWTPCETLGSEEGWLARIEGEQMSSFDVLYKGDTVGRVAWSLTGQHNIQNGLAAIAAARHVGVRPQDACEALSKFKGVKRRMELLGESKGVKLYDDFAHHPTAIATTLAGLRKSVGDKEKIIAVIEPRSNTMQQGVHKAALADSVEHADLSLWYQADSLEWSLSDVLAPNEDARVLTTIDDIVSGVVNAVDGNSAHVVVMSNGGFQGIHSRLLEALKNRGGAS